MTTKTRLRTKFEHNSPSLFILLSYTGWPLAELFDRKIANIFDADVIVDSANRNPSILNGGLGKISPVYWISVLAMATAIDLKQNELAASGSPDYKFPGDLGWDPLGLYPEDEEGQRRMQTAEIKNGMETKCVETAWIHHVDVLLTHWLIEFTGRLAMIAITAFAFQEFVQKFAVINQTPSFFMPAQDVVNTYGSMSPIDTSIWIGTASKS